jgi:DNA processing protein
VKRTWVPDQAWTGEWSVPAVLQRPVTDRERAALVSMSFSGFGPKRLVTVLADADGIEEHAAGGAKVWREAPLLLRRLGLRALVPSDAEYSVELGAIDAAPLLLFVRGARLDELRPMVAVVGARACTSGAARFARRLGEAFASAGFTVVSGLARGIDAAAHRGALDAGHTVAVLGSGIDVCYPPEHRGLLEEVVANGAIVSEFPPGVGPRAWHFPARNRIISGLSCAVVVVEAGVRSGALITAGFGLDQGRHVLACITGPENPAGAGSLLSYPLSMVRGQATGAT